ncbi:HlyD family type I secretion periplasmic adaptor subunit [Celeribacter indicus]|uniref:Membrane fusion protein (MFP) family protein n=1 Tax=Celeribacter indicus TaxID=1208324 RepID=A0A0B5DX09_9RHOB|nr:HlyD family type I secretion periplasmic adaptor subunit [Celeribacter indicus]AJE45276.1 type I secretion membrane fusion protein [Celeribacter indicus]SDX20969.1 HlyD family secretion protein [Celeribacter indicus]
MSGSDASWPVRGAVAFGLACVALLLGGFGTWTVLARIDGAVIAPGRVQVEQNRQVVAHRDGGEVTAVHVAEGDTVAAGALLLELSPAEHLTELALAENRLHELLARAARLEAERDGRAQIDFGKDLRARMATDAQVARSLAGQQDLFAARRATARAEIEQLEKQRHQIELRIDGLAAQKSALGTQARLISADLEDQAALLARGLTQQSRVTALRRDAVQLAAELGRIETTEAQAQVQISEIELEILKAGTDRREAAIAELRDVQAEASRLREQIAGLRLRLDRLDLRAPVSGIVYGLQVFGPGAVVPAAAPVLSIVPQDRPLIVTARINPTEVDRVYPGQPVRLRFPTFARRSTPELAGTVTRISPDAFLDESSGASYYRADIRIPESERARLPEGTFLIPGLPVEAYMSTGERAPIAYLTKPLTDHFTRAFRED